MEDFVDENRSVFRELGKAKTVVSRDILISITDKNASSRYVKIKEFLLISGAPEDYTIGVATFLSKEFFAGKLIWSNEFDIDPERIAFFFSRYLIVPEKIVKRIVQTDAEPNSKPKTTESMSVRF